MHLFACFFTKLGDKYKARVAAVAVAVSVAATVAVSARSSLPSDHTRDGYGRSAHMQEPTVRGPRGPIDGHWRPLVGISSQNTWEGWSIDDS